MMTGGTLALGLANLALAAVLLWIAGQVRDAFELEPGGQTSGLHPLHYLLFILPLVLVGAGFVLATTVRTAIVFASTPRGLPASAAAINEASVGLGSRIGITVATTLLTARAITSAKGLVQGRDDGPTLVAEFEQALYALGTPRFEELYRATMEGSEPIKRAAYAVSYLDGVVVALVLSGIVGVVGAALAALLMGRRDPIKAVFDMQDERAREDYVPTGTPGASDED